MRRERRLERRKQRYTAVSDYARLCVWSTHDALLKLRLIKKYVFNVARGLVEAWFADRATVIFFLGELFSRPGWQTEELSTRGRAKSGLSLFLVFSRQRAHKGEKKNRIFRKTKSTRIDEKYDNFGFSLKVSSAWKRSAAKADRPASISRLRIERSINSCYLYELVNRWIGIVRPSLLTSRS